MPGSCGPSRIASRTDMSISVMEVTCFSIGLPIRAAKPGPPPDGVEELFFTTGSFIHDARATCLAVELAQPFRLVGQARGIDARDVALIAGDGDHLQQIGDQDQI